MGGSLRIGRVAGIGLYVHWTFALLIAWFFFLNINRGLLTAATTIALILAVFGCVLLHELGHALTAKLFDVQTRSITLLPIGGVASLERIPENPTHELLITIDGPLVNLAIAGLLFAILAATGGLPHLNQAQDSAQVMLGAGFLAQLMVINVFLAIFNLIPAFPMDGGRILRAILAYFVPYPTATTVAARVGQALAVVFAIVGLFIGNIWWLLIAAFVFMGAGAEAQMVQTRSAFTGLRVRDGMMTDFRTLHENDTLGEAARRLLAGAQQDFPVVAAGSPNGDGPIVGMLSREDLIRGLTTDGLEGPVSAAMRRDCPTVSDTQPAAAVFQQMRQIGCSAMPVVRDGKLAGLVTTENLTELIALREAVGARGERVVNRVG